MQDSLSAKGELIVASFFCVLECNEYCCCHCCVQIHLLLYLNGRLVHSLLAGLCKRK